MSRAVSAMTQFALFFVFAASVIADPKCCYSKFGDASRCGGYPASASAGICNVDNAAPCSSDADCMQLPTPVPSPIPMPIPAQGKCCWSQWGDASTCGSYPVGGSGPLCGNDGITSCQSDSDCSGLAPPSPAPFPTVTVELNNAVQMPVMAFAAQSYWSAELCSNLTSFALQAGFRFIWSSSPIGSDCQRAQGAAIAASGVPRSELFVAGTVAPGGDCQDLDSCYQQTKDFAEMQFDLLGMDKLDMLMIEFPSVYGDDGIRGQWKAFEELYAAGRVRTIAVSNFHRHEMRVVLDTNGTTPAVNMLEYNVADSSSSEKLAENTEIGAVLQAYSPLEGGELLKDELCASIGEVHGKSAVQVALKWVLQTNATVAMQSTSLSHLIDDMAIFDFTLTDDEMSQLSNRHSSQAAMVL